VGPRCFRRNQQIPRTLRAQAIGKGEFAIEMFQIAQTGNRSELVHYHIGPGLDHRLHDGSRIQSIRDYGHSAGGCQLIDMAWLPGHSEHLVTGRA